MMNLSTSKPRTGTRTSESELSSTSVDLPNNSDKEGNTDDDTPKTTIVTSMEQIQSECLDMISALRELEQEEHDLQCQLEILSREALLCGFQADKVEKVLLRKPSTKRKSGGTAASKKSPPTAKSASPVVAVSTTRTKKIKTEDKTE
jgi:hypothetical protein